MRNRASRTAEHVALFRAVESARVGDRLFEDVYAVRFLSVRYRLVASLSRVDRIGRWVERYIDRRWPAGPRASAVVRTRLIDDLVDEALAGGVQQVLLLGAGYDSRAYRLPRMADARVFEVDHPLTQASKRRLVRAHVPAGRRTHVTFVPVDLVDGDLRAALVAAGFATDESTVVLWEGVTNYLTASAVDATLRQLAAMTGAGSRIIFTYVDSSALDGTGGFAGVEEWQAAVRRHGEPWTFGLDPAGLPDYLAVRGLTLSLDMSALDAGERYLAPMHRREPAAPWYRIAMAYR
ncbi:MAG TPA: class I SAM-dependent methyltransferase [Micromonosporaceae bacterium]|nr:class I SAM-dependent methyltransferase [Micromonosporaceae bacterium]